MFRSIVYSQDDFLFSCVYILSRAFGLSLRSCVLLQVLDKEVMLKLDRKVLFEVSTELSRLLEPVSDPDHRLKLLSNDVFLIIRNFGTEIIAMKNNVGHFSEVNEVGLGVMSPIYDCTTSWC